jgi:Ca2+-binding RTX toxin-like protein
MNGMTPAILFLLIIVGATASAASPFDSRPPNMLVASPRATSRLTVNEPSGGTLVGTAVDERITGSPGPDRLDGGAGVDGLIGLDGDDQLTGGEGDDFLKGGPGNDVLEGGAGNDRYVFAVGDGADRIDDAAGINLLAIEDYSQKHPVAIRRAGNEYVVSYGTGDEVRLSTATFKTLQFLSAATLLSQAQFLELYGVGEAADPRVGSSSSGKRQLTAGLMGGEVAGTAQDEVLIGGPGDDFLNGGGGNDEFQPGSPAGAIAGGGTGNDIYRYGKNDGRLLIQDAGGQDEVRFGPGIRPADVTIEERGGQLQFVIVGSPHNKPSVAEDKRWSVFLTRMSDSPNERIERCVFVDGTVWDYTEITRRKVKVQ